MITIDFETRSAADLKLVGAHEYARHKTTDVLCLAYAIDDKPVSLWIPDQQDPIDLFDAIAAGYKVEGHNVSFERQIWLHVMVERYGWPQVPFKSWRCSMAKAAACGLPQSLDALAKVLELDVLKDKEGAAVMRKICRPVKPPRVIDGIVEDIDESKINWHDCDVDRQTVYDYCITDVEVERACSKQLPDLSETELRVWQLDQEINDRGIKVDRELCEAVVDKMREVEFSANRAIAQRTGSKVTAVTEVGKITKYLREHCPELATVKSLDMATVEAILEESTVTGRFREILELRASNSAASVKKFKAMLNRTRSDGILRGSLAYCGAGQTGRWAGRGVQIQNLFRGVSDVEYIEVLRSCFIGSSAELIELIFANPILAAKNLLRPALIARPGKSLAVWDYGQIEARVLAWLADDQEAMASFKSNADPYKSLAAKIYKVDVDDVSKSQRFVGKTAVLGLGYQMGATKFAAQLAQFGNPVTEEFAQKVVQTYRSTFTGIKRLWYKVERAAISAVRDPKGDGYRIERVMFARKDRFLCCLLPSGRVIRYLDPKIVDGEFGDKIEYRKAGYGGAHRADTYGGKLVENIVQAIARDIMAAGMLRLKQRGYDLLATVHDEVIAEIDKGDQFALDNGRAILENVPAWAKGAPIIVGGDYFESQFYRKG